MPSDQASSAATDTAASPATDSTSSAPPPRLLWVMLLTLLSAFALSQAFRTVTSIIADGLRTDFGLSAQSLGVAQILNLSAGDLPLRIFSGRN